MGVRHPANVVKVATARAAPKFAPARPLVVGFDVETDVATGAPMLMHDSTGRRVIGPDHDPRERRRRVARWARRLAYQDAQAASWRQFDHVAISRIAIEPEAMPVKWRVVERYNRIQPAHSWEEPGPPRAMGVELHAYKNSLKLAFREEREDGERTAALHVLDASRFYFGGLAKVAASRDLDWYEKGAREVHVVDWKRYREDADYARRVDASNLMDAKAAKALMDAVYQDVHEAFNVEARRLSSGGGLAKLALARHAGEEYAGMSWLAVKRAFDARSPEVAELWSIAHEAYAGGLVDAYRLGRHGRAWARDGSHVGRVRAWYADVASAYPGVITRLPSLNGARVVVHEGEPERAPSLTHPAFVRATYTVPHGAWYTVSARLPGGTKARAIGTFRASTTAHEHAWLMDQGASTEDVTTVQVTTRGGLAPVAVACQAFLDLRERLRGTPAERSAKEAANSTYGVQYEMNEEWREEPDGAIVNGSYRAGEVYNPVYSALITGLTRLRLAMGLRAIHDAGGVPVCAMTDSIMWTGDAEHLPGKLAFHDVDTGASPVKRVGWFDPPDEIFDLIMAGVGRYEYRTGKGKWVTKARSYRFPEEADAVFSEARITPALTRAVHEHAGARALRRLTDADPGAVPDPVSVNLRATLLVGPGLVRARKETLHPDMLGLILEDDKAFSPFALGGKRVLPVTRGPYTVERLLAGGVTTEPPTAIPGADYTLPDERDAFLEREAKRERARVARERAKRERWRKAHPELERIRKRRWYSENAERERERQRAKRARGGKVDDTPHASPDA